MGSRVQKQERADIYRLFPLAEEEGFEPSIGVAPYTGFRDRPDQPLWHPLRVPSPAGLNPDSGPKKDFSTSFGAGLAWGNPPNNFYAQTSPCRAMAKHPSRASFVQCSGRNLSFTPGSRICRVRGDDRPVVHPHAPIARFSSTQRRFLIPKKSGSGARLAFFDCAQNDGGRGLVAFGLRLQAFSVLRLASSVGR